MTSDKVYMISCKYPEPYSIITRDNHTYTQMNVVRIPCHNYRACSYIRYGRNPRTDIANILWLIYSNSYLL